MRRVLFAACLSVLFAVHAAAEPQPKFRPQTIDANLEIGYGLAIGDVDGDAKPDVLLADKRQFVWYGNGEWQRNVMVDGLTEFDNVCLAARDLDGDGKVEVAVGAQWNPGETSDPAKSGSVHYLLRPDDPKSRWTPVRLPHEPTVHRMHWVKADDGKRLLVVLPLHGRGNKDGAGAGVRILAYEMPEDPAKEWPTTLLDDSMHLTHNFDVFRFQQAEAEGMMVAGKEGVREFFQTPDGWDSVLHALPETRGAGEVRYAGESRTPFIATIEPMHGNEVAVYIRAGTQASSGAPIWNRQVLDDSLNQGHALACADLLSLGKEQVIAGWRNPNAQGKVGIKVYIPSATGIVKAAAPAWTSFALDNGTMACEDLKVADLNADGKLDVIACGRATKNLIIYWNETE